MHMYIFNSSEINTCIRDHCSKLYSTISLKEFVYIEYILFNKICTIIQKFKYKLKYKHVFQ